MRSWYLNYAVILPPGTAVNLCLGIGCYAQSIGCLDDAARWLHHAQTLAADPVIDISKRLLVVAALCSLFLQQNCVEKAMDLLSKHIRLVDCGSNKLAKALFAYIDGHIAYSRSQSEIAKYVTIVDAIHLRNSSFFHREKFTKTMSFVGGVHASTPHSQLAALALSSLASVQLKLDGIPTDKTEQSLRTSVILSDAISNIPACIFQLQLLSSTPSF